MPSWFDVHESPQKQWQDLQSGRRNGSELNQILADPAARHEIGFNLSCAMNYNYIWLSYDFLVPRPCVKSLSFSILSSIVSIETSLVLSLEMKSQSSMIPVQKSQIMFSNRCLIHPFIKSLFTIPTIISEKVCSSANLQTTWTQVFWKLRSIYQPDESLITNLW